MRPSSTSRYWNANEYPGSPRLKPTVDLDLVLAQERSTGEADPVWALFLQASVDALDREAREAAERSRIKQVTTPSAFRTSYEPPPGSVQSAPDRPRIILPYEGTDQA